MQPVGIARGRVVEGAVDRREARSCLRQMRVARRHELSEPIGAMGRDHRAQPLDNQHRRLARRVQRVRDLARGELPAGESKGEDVARQIKLVAEERLGGEPSVRALRRGDVVELGERAADGKVGQRDCG